MGERGAEELAGRIAMARVQLAGMFRCVPSAVAGVLLVAVPAAAQEDTRPCVFLCAPELKIEPTFTVENLGGEPRVETDGHVERVGAETVFELIVALDVPTQIPRIGVTLEAIFVPFGETSVHPFTEVSAANAGRQSFRDNGIEFEAELNLELLEEDQSAGWVSSHFDVVDKFSPGDTPRDSSVYTHKLNFEWDTAFHVFNRLPSGNWLRNVEIEVSLDYVATGLPRAGDIVGGKRFLDNANPWSLSIVSVFPLAPLVP